MEVTLVGVPRWDRRVGHLFNRVRANWMKIQQALVDLVSGWGTFRTMTGENSFVFLDEGDYIIGNTFGDT